MFSKYLHSIIAAALVATSTSVAYGDSYFGGNAAFIDYSEDGASKDAGFDVLYGKVGTQINSVISVEGRIGVGTKGETVSGVDANNIDHLFGAYVRVGVPTGSAFYPYAIVGYTRTNLERSFLGFSLNKSESVSDVSYGAGADINLKENLSLNVEYMNYFDTNKAKLDGVSVGIVKKF